MAFPQGIHSVVKGKAMVPWWNGTFSGMLLSFGNPLHFKTPPHEVREGPCFLNQAPNLKQSRNKGKILNFSKQYFMICKYQQQMQRNIKDYGSRGWSIRANGTLVLIQFRCWHRLPALPSLIIVSSVELNREGKGAKSELVRSAYHCFWLSQLLLLLPSALVGTSYHCIRGYKQC